MKKIINTRFEFYAKYLHNIYILNNTRASITVSLNFSKNILIYMKKLLDIFITISTK
ncbi:MAG: hypothetical protein ACI8WT_003740 [Clostridium sp.]|jgi:hypothetical protein